MKQTDKPKILLLGYGRHGKDTVAEMLQDRYGFSFTSSSMFCAERVVFPRMADLYSNAQECFEDRHNHRARWYDLITEFNKPDASALGRAIFAEYDIYAGLRNSTEFHACKNAGVFDVCVWVDRSKHLPPEDRSSCTVEPWMADYVLDNNGDLDDLAFNLEQLMPRIMGTVRS